MRARQFRSGQKWACRPCIEWIWTGGRAGAGLCGWIRNGPIRQNKMKEEGRTRLSRNTRLWPRLWDFPCVFAYVCACDLEASSIKCHSPSSSTIVVDTVFFSWTQSLWSTLTSQFALQNSLPLPTKCWVSGWLPHLLAYIDLGIWTPALTYATSL